LRVRSKVFYALLFLQLAISLGTLLTSRSLYQIDSHLLVQEGQLTTYRQAIHRVSSQLDSGQQNGLDDLRWRDFARQNAAAMLSLAQATRTSLPSEDSAVELARIDAQQQAEAFAHLASAATIGDAQKQQLGLLVSQAATRLEQWRDLADAIQQECLHEAERAQWKLLWVNRLAVANRLLLFSTFLSLLLLRRDMRKQVETQIQIEADLRKERSTLEMRVQTRTAELEAEVKERVRVEKLNRGRNQVLEMLAHNEPADKIFCVLAEILGRHRSSWSCAIHLLQNDALFLHASAAIPDKLLPHLQRLSGNLAGAP